MLGESNADFFPLIIQLIVCEENVYNGMQENVYFEVILEGALLNAVQDIKQEEAINIYK